ncbi:hypothetical protein Tco_0742067 [Tanacetum coccineum]
MKGVGHRVADSYIGNHLEDGFTPLETIQSAKDTIAVQRCGLSAKELNEFLSSHPIPLEYNVIFPTSTQTIFDAPSGYVSLYTHSFSLANLRLPLIDFFCEVLQYFKVHISRLNPFGCAKLTTFIIMCKAYGCEPSVDLFRDSIISSKFPQLLLDENKLNLTSFKDKLPPNIDENPYFQRLDRYPTGVRMFDDPILFLAGLKPSWEFGQKRLMTFRNFIYTEDDDDLAFLPKEPSSGFGTSSPSASVNTKLPKDVEEPQVQPAEITVDSGESLKVGVFVVHLRSVAALIKERKCKTRRGSSRPPVKRKLASRSLSSCVVRVKPMLLRMMLLFFPYLMMRVVVDNAVNRRAREFLQVIKKMSGEADNPVVLALREKISSLTVDVKEHKGNLDRMMLESQNWAGYQVTLSTLESKVNSLKAKKAKLEAVEASLRREVEELKQDRRDVVLKVVPYATMELVHSDELSRLVGTLVSSAITYGRCRAYEQVAAMKEPFDLSKAKGYHEFVADVTAPIEGLLSKNPPTLQKPAPSRTQMHVPSS